ncbi:MAG: hypothetical protein H6607_07505 [Flavobacteriales bacterium]|nr:hypothetical protein [Flavobacteriales bacterium]
MDDKLTKLMRAYGEQNAEFSEGFTDRVMNEVLAEKQLESGVIKLWYKRILLAAAACIATFLITSFLLDGNLSADSLMGLGQHSEQDIVASIETYRLWDIN